LGIDFKTNLSGTLEEYRSGKTVYFKEKHIELHNELIYNEEKSLLTILPGKLVMNEGDLEFSGKIDFADNANLDLHFEGRKNSFDMFIGMAPEAVIQAMGRFTTRGDVYLKGSITGPSLHQNPNINIEIGCANTFFKDKKSKKDVVKELQFKGFFNTGKDNSLATSVFYLESLYGAPENSFLKGMFRVENFEKPLINMDFHADLDMRYLPQLLPSDNLTQSTGKVKIDITLNEFVTAENVLVVASRLKEGTESHIDFENVTLKFKQYPHPISNLNGSICLVGDLLKTKNLKANILDNDLLISAQVDDLLHYLHGDDAPVNVKLEAASHKLSPGILVPKEMQSSISSIPKEIWKDELLDFYGAVDILTTTKALQNFKYLPSATIDFHHFRFRTKQYGLPVNEFKGHIDLSDQQFKLKDLTVHIGKNKLVGDIAIWPLSPLMDSTDKNWSNIKIDLKSPYFDVKQILTYDGVSYVNKNIEKEIIHKLDFKAHGRLLGNSIGPKGFSSSLDIDRLSFRLNELPLIEKVSGYISTDTLGSIHILNFKASVGKTDIYSSLDLLHFLDGDLKNKNIKGNFKANYLDVDELAGYQPGQTENGHETNVQHEAAFNIFEFPFPNLILILSKCQLIVILCCYRLLEA
jgi:hypothetical protein